VVHQRDAGEPRLVRREGDLSQPHRRVLAPREPGHLKDHVEPVPGGGCRHGSRDDRRHRCDVDDPGHAVPALVAEGGSDSPERAELLGQHPRRNRSVPGRVAGTTEVGRGVERDGHRRQRVSAGQVEQPTPTLAVETQGVDDCRETPAHPAGHDQVQQREGLGRGVQVVSTAADQAAQVVGGDDLRRAVAGSGPS
jgi:hypothetical protein